MDEYDDNDIEILPPSMIQQLSKAELDQQVETAKRYPRMVSRCLDNIRTLATMNEEVATSCFYKLPRGGKKIEGPSIRFAEILASQWGNIVYGARVLEVTDRAVVAQGMCRDLESNTVATKTASRSIIDSCGRRYSADMINVTSNAACSVALRNSIFSVIPQAVWTTVYQETRVASLGKGTIEEKRKRTLEWFERRKVTQDQVCELVGARAIEDLDLDRLITLRGVTTAIRDGDTTLAALLSRSTGDDAEDLKAVIGEINAKKAQNGGGKKSEPQPEQRTEPDSNGPPDDFDERQPGDDGDDPDDRAF